MAAMNFPISVTSTRRRVRLWLWLLPLASCATAPPTVRQIDLDAWRSVPVQALDNHSFFSTVPMIRMKTAAGVEIRNYASRSNADGWSVALDKSLGTFVNAEAFQARANAWEGCNNFFYIENGRVTKYAPLGPTCFTNDSVRPARSVSQD